MDLVDAQLVAFVDGSFVHCVRLRQVHQLAVGWVDGRVCVCVCVCVCVRECVCE